MVNLEADFDRFFLVQKWFWEKVEILFKLAQNLWLVFKKTNFRLLDQESANEYKSFYKFQLYFELKIFNHLKNDK